MQGWRGGWDDMCVGIGIGIGIGIGAEFKAGARSVKGQLGGREGTNKQTWCRCNREARRI
jgi:hypothetical protein